MLVIITYHIHSYVMVIPGVVFGFIVEDGVVICSAGAIITTGNHNIK